MTNLSDFFEQDQQDNTPKVNPISALQDRYKQIDEQLSSLKPVQTPKLSDPVSGPGDPDTMSAEVLRGLFSAQIPGSQDPKFGEAFRQSISPAKEVLANMFNGISASMLGTKFRSVRDQAFEQFVTEKKLNQEKEQLGQQLMIHKAQLAAQFVQHKRDDDTRRAIEDIRSTENEADRAEKILSLKERTAKGELDVAKYLSGEKDKAANLELNKQKAERTGDHLWDASHDKAKAALTSKGIDTATPQGQALLFQATRAEWESMTKFKASVTGKKEKAGAGNEGLVQTVLANPALFDQLTPTVRTAIAPELAKNGFTGFGKPLAEGAINKLAETRSAVHSLNELRDVLIENKEFIGPLKGFAAVNPFNTKARLAQAKIDLVKQTVGKALEGGVLRKEDEEKYKKILATLRDEPTTAVGKVDGLIVTLNSNIGTFIEEQKAAGRKVGSPSPSTTIPMTFPDGTTRNIPASEAAEAETKYGGKRK